MEKVKVALIGYGHLGKWHAEKAETLDSSELVAIVEPSKEGAKRARDAYSNILVVDSLDKVIDKIDAGLIVTPTSLHYQYISDLLKADKHVFCEKPLVSNISECEALEKLVGGAHAQSKGPLLQVGHSERFHAAWGMLDKHKNLMEQTDSVVHIFRLAPFKGRATDVDVINDLMIHDLDLLYFLSSELPCEVEARGFKNLTDYYDYVSAKLFFPSGRVAYITVGRNQVEEMRSFEVNNSVGCLKVDLLNAKLSFSYRGERGEESYGKKDHLLIEQKHFYESILNKKDAIVDFEAGRRAVQMISIIHDAIEKGEPIKCKW